MHDSLIALYKVLFSEEPLKVTPLTAHASNRQMFRMVGPARSVIGVVSPNRFENRAFCEFTAHFRKHGLPVPLIHGLDAEAGLYIEEDLGNETLFDVLSARRSAPGTMPAEVESLYVKAVQILPRFQVVAGRTLDYELCYPRRAYDRDSKLWDMRFFRDSFLRRTGVAFDESALEADFERFGDFLELAPADFFMYRDFQSRNIMVRDGELFFIDYQGGRRGPLHYDVASLLYQSKANIPADARMRILEAYLAAIGEFVPVERTSFVEHLHAFVLVRLLQVLGTYGEQGLHLKKSYFIESIPYAVKNLRVLLPDLGFMRVLPELGRIFEELVQFYGGEELK